MNGSLDDHGDYPLGVNLPSCMAHLDGGVPDGWNPPQATGDYGADFKLGCDLANEAVKHAREIHSHGLITFILATIQAKSIAGDIVLGGTEHGFTDRICRLACVGALN